MTTTSNWSTITWDNQSKFLPVVCRTHFFLLKFQQSFWLVITLQINHDKWHQKDVCQYISMLIHKFTFSNILSHSHFTIVKLITASIEAWESNRTINRDNTYKQSQMGYPVDFITERVTQNLTLFTYGMIDIIKQWTLIIR